jgi:hypothetical protein
MDFSRRARAAERRKRASDASRGARSRMIARITTLEGSSFATGRRPVSRRRWRFPVRNGPWRTVRGRGRRPIDA